MLSKTFSAAVQNIGLTITPDHAYGIYGGYLLTVYESGSKKTAFFNFLLDENEDNTLAALEISDTIKSNISTYSILNYDLQDDGLSITTSQGVPTFLKIIDFCTELLNEHKVMGSEYCSACGKKFGKRYPKKLTRRNNNYLLCESCTLEVLEEQDKPDEETGGTDAGRDSYKGVIAAVVSGLIGVFLYYACYRWLLPLTVEWETWDFRYVLTALGFATSFLVYIGYTMFNKKACLTSYLSVSVTAVLATIIGQYIGIIVEILNDHPVKFSLIYKTLLKMPLRSTALEGFKSYSTDFYILAVISAVLAAVGSVIFLLGLYDKSRKVKEEFKIETLKIKSN
ncbi:MAG: hypothetical protein CVU97_05430 [Firmicutes bacterium HGW-Firmicutes-21]|nr:MAG: hypothetical protein CVU97_05430 [Firmicutes bacterium HGW-Firmicutes-21]